MTYKVQSVSVGLVQGEDRRVFIQWKDKKSSQTDSYEYDWEYNDGKRWLPGSTGSASPAEAGIGGGRYRNEWNAPDYATKARARVKPVSKKHKVGKKDQAYYSSGWCSRKTHNFYSDKLPTPDVEVELDENGVTVTVKVKSDDSDCNYCDIVWYNGSKKVGGKNDYRCDGEASYKMTMKLGASWKFRARVRSTKNTRKGVSDWSGWETLMAKPAAPTKAAA